MGRSLGFLLGSCTDFQASYFIKGHTVLCRFLHTSLLVHSILDHASLWIVLARIQAQRYLSSLRRENTVFPSLLVAKGRPLDSLQNLLCLIIRASCSLNTLIGREVGGMFIPSSPICFCLSLRCIIYFKYILGRSYTTSGAQFNGLF